MRRNSRCSLRLTRAQVQLLMENDVDFDKIILALGRASYWDRRRFLRHKIKPNYPRFLYRYRPIDLEHPESSVHLRDVLVHSRLWLSAPIDFNDPFDMTGRVVLTGSGKDVRDRIAKLVKNQRADLKWKYRKAEVERLMRDWPEKLPAVLQTSIDKSLANVGVCSFSADSRNIQMWSHYASDHRGIVLQFEVARDPQVFLKAIPVEYDDQYPLLDWVGGSGGDLRKAILRKHSGWRYERERRIIEINLAHTYLSFKPEALTGIIFGCRVDSTTRAVIQKLLAERHEHGSSSVSLYEARKHPSRFKIVIHGADDLK